MVFVSQEPPVQTIVQYPEASLELEEEVKNAQDGVIQKKGNFLRVLRQSGRC
jgi:hypothetical protein